MKRASKKKSTVYENGNSIHRLPLMYGIGAIISLLIPIIIITAFIIEKDSIDNNDILNGMPIIILFSTFGTIMSLMVWMNKIYLNPNKITQRNMWGKIRTIEMREIKTIKYDNVFSYLEISDGDKVIKCYDYLVGIEEILNTLSKQTNMTRKQMGYNK